MMRRFRKMMALTLALPLTPIWTWSYPAEPQVVKVGALLPLIGERYVVDHHDGQAGHRGPGSQIDRGNP